MALLEESLRREFWRNQAEAQRLGSEDCFRTGPDTLPIAIISPTLVIMSRPFRVGRGHRLGHPAMRWAAVARDGD
jgi:hypothetical protein